MADAVFNCFKKEIMDGTVNLANMNIMCTLTTGFVVDIDDHSAYADVSAFEVTTTGNIAGGTFLLGTAVTQDNTDNEGMFDANDITFGNSYLAANGLVLFEEGASSLIAYYDIGSNESINGNFTITWNAEGLINLG